MIYKIFSFPTGCPVIAMLMKATFSQQQNQWVCKEMNRTEIERGVWWRGWCWWWGLDVWVEKRNKVRKWKQGLCCVQFSRMVNVFLFPPNEHTGNNVTACLEPKERLSEEMCVCFFVCFHGGSLVSYRLGNTGCGVNIYNIFLICSKCCSLSASAGRPKRMAESHSSKPGNQIQKCAYNLLFCTALTKTTANCNDRSWVPVWQAETVTHTLALTHMHWVCFWNVLSASVPQLFIKASLPYRLSSHLFCFFSSPSSL